MVVWASGSQRVVGTGQHGYWVLKDLGVQWALSCNGLYGYSSERIAKAFGSGIE